MLGRTFLVLVHVGRSTGRAHETVAMVLAQDANTGDVVICSGWDPDVDWIRNLRAGPGKQVHMGRDRFLPEHRFLTNDEALAVAVAFLVRDPRRNPHDVVRPAPNTLNASRASPLIA